MSDERREDPVLITDAQISYEEELAVRKRRYKWMMGMRIPCMILATAFYQIPWLAVTLLVISVPLPWIAVLIANDRLPRKAATPSRYRPERAELESRPHPVVESGVQAGDRASEPGDGPGDGPGAQARPGAGTGG